jgi:hypothetical protein
VRLDHNTQFGKFRHVTDYDSSPANGSGRSALPKNPHGANLSVQSPMSRGMPIESLSAIRMALQSGQFHAGEEGSELGKRSYPSVPARRRSGGCCGARAIPGTMGHISGRKRLPGPPRGECLSTLNDAFTSPFCFLDIACGDASIMKAALRGTQYRYPIQGKQAFLARLS